MYRIVTSVVLVFLFTAAIYPQSFDTKIETKNGTKTESESASELKKQAIEFLRESAGEVNNLRTLENRISFASEMAGLMWLHDEKEARAMMNSVVSDFRQLITQYDAQITALGIEMPESENFYGGFFGSGDPSGKTNLLRKLSMAMVPVRQQITLSIAEHDPQFAVNFYNDSLQLLSNVETRKRFEERSSYFEIQLINRIAENRPVKAVELARKSLAKSLNYNHIELLKKIYDKDAEKGAEYAAEVAKKLKEEKIDSDNFYMLGMSLRLGAESLDKAKKDNKKPMFTEEALRELAELTAQAIMQRTDYEELRSDESLKLIERFAPARAVQIRAKMQVKSTRETGDVKSVRIASAPEIGSPQAAAKTTGEKNEMEEALKNLQNLENKQLPKEEREKIINRARKIISATENKQQKIMALSALAAQINTLGDRELASDIMKDAQALISPTPKNYLEFMEVWIFVNGLTAVDAEKAFPVLDDTIFRLNDTLSAFIKVGEFMDVSGEMIADGEVQVGRFGGSMVKELTNNLAMANPTILNLAKADFTKTKALTNRFDRPEARILAKMLVLRAILDDKKKTIEEN